ncbi:hypothetical protein LXA43DRAFT_1095059 [Ganoderma leucocontextum]|nr:hypothetical protein LXA43DRAFT_1095059 [Ganoderma leucocontextum]
MPPRRNVVLSDEDLPLPSEPELKLTRRAAQNAPGVWRRAYGISTPPKDSNKEGQGGDGKGKKKAKTKRKPASTVTPAAQPSVASKFPPPAMSTNTSDDEPPKSPTSGKRVSKKAPKSSTLVKSSVTRREPEVDGMVLVESGKARSASGKKVRRSNSSESSSESSTDEEDEEESQSSGELEALTKKNPGALNALFENERPFWQDDGEDGFGEQDLFQEDEFPRRSRNSTPNRSPARSSARSPLRDSPVGLTPPSQSYSRSGTQKRGREQSPSDMGLSSLAPPAKKKGKLLLQDDDHSLDDADEMGERTHTKGKRRAREEEKHERKRRAREEEKHERKRRAREEEKHERKRRAREEEEEEHERKCRAREEEEKERKCRTLEGNERGREDKEKRRQRDGKGQVHTTKMGGASSAGGKTVGSKKKFSSSAPPTGRKRVNEVGGDGHDHDSEDENEQESSHPHLKCRRRQEDDNSDLASENGEDDDPRMDLVWYGSSRPNLGDLPPRVYRVAVRAIRECELNVCLLNAFPDEDGNFTRSVLIKHAKELGFKDILAKLKSNKETDELYHKKLGLIPAHRVFVLHGKVKKLGQRQVKAAYGLTVGDGAKVKWLLDGIAYIFPHDYKAQTVNGDEAFSLPVFEDMLADAFFSRRTSFGYRIADHFTSSLLESPDEKEIPAAMLALVSTAIYACIDDYKSPRYEAGRFEVNQYLDAYQQNIGVLDDIKTGNPEAYHALMHGLFTRVTGGGSAHAGSKKTYLNVAGAVAVQACGCVGSAIDLGIIWYRTKDIVSVVRTTRTKPLLASSMLQSGVVYCLAALTFNTIQFYFFVTHAMSLAKFSVTIDSILMSRFILNLCLLDGRDPALEMSTASGLPTLVSRCPGQIGGISVLALANLGAPLDFDGEPDGDDEEDDELHLLDMISSRN